VTKVLKRLDLLLKEVKDPVAQENFWRLRRILEDISQSGLAGPQGPQGPPGPPGTGGVASQAPKLIETFDTDVGTLAGDFVKVSGVNAVTKVSDNLIATIPNGIFGIGLSKPSPLQIEVIFIGIMGGYAGLTAGLPLFVSPTGTPTHTAPTSGIVQQIGFAISADQLFLQIGQCIRRS